MDRLLQLAYRLARVGTWAGGGLVILAAVLIGIDIFMRKVFSVSIGGASELSGYVLAISTSWALAFTLLERAHIRIDSLYVLLPARLCAVLDVLGLLAMLVFASCLAWQGSFVFFQSYQYGSRALSPIATPLVYPQFLWVVGLVFFFLVIVLLLIRAIIALITGDVATVQRIAGSRTSQQELDEELEELGKRAQPGEVGS